MEVHYLPTLFIDYKDKLYNNIVSSNFDKNPVVDIIERVCQAIIYPFVCLLALVESGYRFVISLISSSETPDKKTTIQDEYNPPKYYDFPYDYVPDRITFEIPQTSTNEELLQPHLIGGYEGSETDQENIFKKLQELPENNDVIPDEPIEIVIDGVGVENAELVDNTHHQPDNAGLMNLGKRWACKVIPQILPETKIPLAAVQAGQKIKDALVCVQEGNKLEAAKKVLPLAVGAAVLSSASVPAVAAGIAVYKVGTTMKLFYDTLSWAHEHDQRLEEEDADEYQDPGAYCEEDSAINF